MAGLLPAREAFNKSGPGTVILTGDNTYAGTTTIAGGVLQLGNGQATGSITGDVANGGTLIFNRSDTLTYGGVISGAGAVQQVGAGTTVLTGDSTYTGATTITAGTLQIGNGGATGSLVSDITTTVFWLLTGAIPSPMAELSPAPAPFSRSEPELLF